MTDNHSMYSKFLREQERGSRVVLFHELHPSPIFLSKDKWIQFKKDPSSNRNLRDSLEAKKLIIRCSDDDLKELKIARAILEKKLDQTTILYLMMAQHCNLACSYCPIPGLAKIYGDVTLSESDARAGVDLWAHHLNTQYDESREYYVIFYGGEPLLNKPVINSTLRYLKDSQTNGQLPSNIRRMIATNGLLIDNETISLCQEHDIIVAVGIDGFSREVNEAREFRQSGKTTDEVIKVIQTLVNRGITTCASVSITPDNIDAIEEYHAIFERLGVEKFGFNLLKGRALADYPGTDPVEFYHKASRAIINGFQNQSRPDLEYQMEKKHTVFSTQDFFPLDCTCYGSQIVIQPNGQVTNCPFFRNDMGHVSQLGKDFRIWETETARNWRQRLPLFNPAFRDFDAKSLCGGGCAWGSIESTGNHMEPDLASTIFAKEAFDYLLWKQDKEGD